MNFRIKQRTKDEMNSSRPKYVDLNKKTELSFFNLALLTKLTPARNVIEFFTCQFYIPSGLFFPETSSLAFFLNSFTQTLLNVFKKSSKCPIFLK